MPRSEHSLQVLYEDNHLLAVNKPAMLPTMGVAVDRPSLLNVAKEYVRTTYNKPGNVYLGVVSRLDAPVTGLVLLAKTSKAAARLSEAFRLRSVDKTYLAAVEGAPTPASGVLEHYLRKDERHRKVHATSQTCPDAQLARLEYRVLNRRDDLALVEVNPETGRKHQIRVQLAKAGHAIVGDRKYGSKAPFSAGIALHSFRLEIEHPVGREPLRIEAPLPAAWRSHRGISLLLSSS
jgi:23S rRNA pseudouridine1911/1915/1917 synthase